MTLVLNLEPLDFNPEALRLIETHACYRALPEGLGKTEAFWDEVAAADAIWTRLGFKIDADFLNRAKNLSVIVTPTTGLNHIDVAACEGRGIRIICLKGETAFLSSVTSTAELTLSLMLEAMRHTGRAHRAVTSEGVWERDRFRGRQLSGQRLGLIGLGRLGKIVAEYALALRMKVIFHDIADVAHPEVLQSVSRDELLATSDIVSLHASYTPQNRHMIGKEELALMQPHAWLINTARGELVNEAALLAALKAGTIEGAAIDVLDDETQAVAQGLDHPLVAYARECNNLIITPHIGGACWDAMHATELFAAQKLKDLLAGDQT